MRCPGRLSWNSSRRAVALPNARRAANRASVALMPLRRNRSSSIARCDSISSAKSSSDRRRNHAKHRVHRIELPSAELRAQDQCHRVGDPTPLARLLRELFLTGGRQFIKARAPIVIGDAPLCADPPGGLEALQRGIERAMVDEQRALRRMLNGERDAMAMVRAERQRAQNE